MIKGDPGNISKLVMRRVCDAPAQNCMGCWENAPGGEGGREREPPLSACPHFYAHGVYIRNGVRIAAYNPDAGAAAQRPQCRTAFF